MKNLIEWFKKWLPKKEIKEEIPVNCLSCGNLSSILKLKTLDKVHACKYHGYVTEPATASCSDFEKSYR